MSARVVQPGRKHGCAECANLEGRAPGSPKTGRPYVRGRTNLTTISRIAARHSRVRPGRRRGSNPPDTAGPQRAKPHQFLVLFVPKTKRERLQAGEEGNRLDLGGDCGGGVTFLQMIVGDERAQMMNVMKSDVARKPLQDARQFIERAPLQCGLRVVPFIAALPIGALELMLHVK